MLKLNPKRTADDVISGGRILASTLELGSLRKQLVDKLFVLREFLVFDVKGAAELTFINKYETGRHCLFQ